ncbi:MAG: right-handed parallel beta-helix repeat-containing protein [Planctomycetota bacterium]
MRSIAGFLALVVCAGVSSVQGGGQAQAVPTFHCVGLYWNAETGSEDNTCRVRYRESGWQDWREALPLWFDGRKLSPVGRAGRGAEKATKWEHGGQYRGSIVNLKPGTEYGIELSLEETNERQRLKVKTWSESFPVGEKVEVSDRDETLVVGEGGTAEGYLVYAPPQGRETAVIDIRNDREHCIEVRASFVIIRGLTLKGARIHGIRIFEGCHDVVIEGCDISGWGRISEDGWGRNLDSAVYSRQRDLTRVIVQRNRIHHPRGDSNNWRENRPRPGKREAYHPEGAQAVYFADSAGNHVIRYNTVFSDDDHQYNDIFGAGANFSTHGFPNRDSDIYGNHLSHCWDDTIESEGANCNVRIWGNYSTDCYVAIATAGTSVGPLYVWRNISGAMRVAEGRWSGGFLKTSDIMGGGKIFVFHNTVLQPPEKGKDGATATGASIGLGWGGPTVNITSRNNVLDVSRYSFRGRNDDPLADYDYDLYRGGLPGGRQHEKHGITGKPIHAAGQPHALARNSPGHDAAVRIANFNDDFLGAAPDMGAEELGAAPLEFGVGAYRD